MSLTTQDVAGEVIKRLSFGEETACQEKLLRQGIQSTFDLENDENALKDTMRGQELLLKPMKTKQLDHQRALEEIRQKSFRFNILEEAAKTDYRESGPGKLASLKDHFSKLKFEYTELETKEHFVRAVAEEGDRVLAGEEVKGSFLLEGVVGNQKTKVQELKILKEQTGLSINNIVDQIAGEMAELEKEQEAVAADLAACGRSLQTWEQTQEALAAAQGVESMENLEGLYSHQEAQLQRLAEQELASRQAGAESKADAERTTEQIADLRGRLQDAEEERLRLEEAAEQVGRVSKSTETYEEMLKLLHDLAGVHVTGFTDRQLQLRVTTHISTKVGRRKQAEIEHDLVVDRRADGPEIENATICPADVDISDILDTVRGSQRLDVLVREIRQRMSCYALRASQVARATRATKYKMKSNKTNMIQVALPSTGIIAFVDAPYDWPSEGIALRLESLLTRSGEPAFRDDLLSGVLERVNVTSAAQEGDLISFLQSIESDLQNGGLA